MLIPGDNGYGARSVNASGVIRQISLDVEAGAAFMEVSNAQGNGDRGGRAELH